MVSAPVCVLLPLAGFTTHAQHSDGEILGDSHAGAATLHFGIVRPASNATETCHEMLALQTEAL